MWYESGELALGYGKWTKMPLHGRNIRDGHSDMGEKGVHTRLDELHKRMRRSRGRGFHDISEKKKKKKRVMASFKVDEQ